MGGGDMGADPGPPACKISMLFNTLTIDACFLSEQWHVRSKGGFAGSCIGVILLTMSLEFLRRSVKSYDRYIIRQHASGYQTISYPTGSDNGFRGEGSTNKNNVTTRASPAIVPAFKPSVFQQAIRAALHMVQFAVAYIIMLLAMYFNVYIIICIFIGAFLGAFVFHWENLTDGDRETTSAAHEATVCCA